jgi:hypothetical protein
MAKTGRKIESQEAAALKVAPGMARTAATLAGAAVVPPAAMGVCREAAAAPAATATVVAVVRARP